MMSFRPQNFLFTGTSKQEEGSSDCCLGIWLSKDLKGSRLASQLQVPHQHEMVAILPRLALSVRELRTLHRGRGGSGPILFPTMGAQLFPVATRGVVPLQLRRKAASRGSWKCFPLRRWQSTSSHRPFWRPWAA